MRARTGGVARVYSRELGQARVFCASGISARVSMTKGRVPDPN